MLRILAGYLLLVSAFVLGPIRAAVPGSGVAEPAPPAIAGLAVVQRDGVYQVSFRLEHAFDSETTARIASGLETAFDYRIEVLRRRRLWPDERAQQHRVVASVRYDSLSRQYSLMLKVDGEVERSFTTDKPEEMRSWVTEIRGVSLGPVSDFVPPEDYVVRVKSDFQPRFVLFFIPWDRDTSWARIPLNPGGVAAHDPAK